jgi:DNA-binding XRE family transcriptional regulator/quercetin dioxygenase-like cupin family protein
MQNNTQTAQDLSLGEKLRMRRKRRDLSLKDVAAKSGISIGQLSQIERDISQPSLRALTQICDVLNIPVGWLFETRSAIPLPSEGPIVRTGTGRVMVLGEQSMTKELMTPDACNTIQMMRIQIQPGGSSGEQPYLARGHARCATVTMGRMHIEIDRTSYDLGPGDSFAVEADCELLFSCIGDTPCEIIWVVTPAIY